MRVIWLTSPKLCKHIKIRITAEQQYLLPKATDLAPPLRGIKLLCLVHPDSPDNEPLLLPIPGCTAQRAQRQSRRSLTAIRPIGHRWIEIWWQRTVVTIVITIGDHTDAKTRSVPGRNRCADRAGFVRQRWCRRQIVRGGGDGEGSGLRPQRR